MIILLTLFILLTMFNVYVTGPGQGSASRYIFITLVEVLWKYWKYDTEISDAGQHLLFLHSTGLYLLIQLHFNFLSAITNYYCYFWLLCIEKQVISTIG